MSIDKKAEYYDVGGIEAIDVVKAKLTPEQYKGFMLGSSIVYLLRANHKGDFGGDIRKARIYLQMLETYIDRSWGYGEPKPTFFGRLKDWVGCLQNRACYLQGRILAFAGLARESLKAWRNG